MRKKLTTLFISFALLLVVLPGQAVMAHKLQDSSLPAVDTIVTGDSQLTPLDSRFPQLLQVRVANDVDAPLSGVTVNFSAPASGPSGTFVDSGVATTSILTDANGIASIAFRANSVEGAYTVSAAVSGLTDLQFNLRNYARSSSANFLQDGSFESSLIGNIYYDTYWSQYSYQFNTPLCSATACGGTFPYAHPRTGAVWIWFGGIYNYAETAYVQQSVVLPAGAPATLRFYLWTGYASLGSDVNDNMLVTLDGTQLFATNATQISLYPQYKLVAVDLSSFADGGTRTLRIAANTTLQNVTFNVDDVSINHALFGDVAPDFWAWSQVETLYQNGVTGGCSNNPRMYCAGNPVTRAEMAVFLLRALGITPPPASGTRFTDVPASYWAAASIEKLADLGITTGCTANSFCPDSPVLRDEMAVFLLRAKGIFTPPPASGTRFTDVPAGFWAADFIENLADLNITTGCTANTYCPANMVTRDQMAVFLVRAFSLH